MPAYPERPCEIFPSCRVRTNSRCADCKRPVCGTHSQRTWKGRRRRICNECQERKREPRQSRARCRRPHCGFRQPEHVLGKRGGRPVLLCPNGGSTYMGHTITRVATSFGEGEVMLLEAITQLMLRGGRPDDFGSLVRSPHFAEIVAKTRALRGSMDRLTARRATATGKHLRLGDDEDATGTD